MYPKTLKNYTHPNLSLSEIIKISIGNHHLLLQLLREEDFSALFIFSPLAAEFVKLKLGHRNQIICHFSFRDKCFDLM